MKIVDLKPGTLLRGRINNRVFILVLANMKWFVFDKARAYSFIWDRSVSSQNDVRGWELI